MSSERSLELSVPGSYWGPVLYSVYASLLQTEIPASVRLNAFADDHSSNYAFKANNREQEAETMNCLEQCILNVNRWMNQNRLKMNTDKTEFILLGSWQHLRTCSTKNINVCGNLVKCSEQIRLLGTWLDQSLTLKHQINMKCHTEMFNLQKIRHIWQVLTMDACWTLVFGLVTSDWDYANALYLGLPGCDIAKLQHVQNAAAKVVLNKTKYNSATQALKNYTGCQLGSGSSMLLTLVYKSLKGMHKNTFQDLLLEHQPSRDGLRFGNEPGIALIVPRTKCKTFADRSFSVAGPRLWNSQPHHIRTIDNLDSFKAKLKTHLFNKAFN